MGFHVEINSILRDDNPFALKRGSEHPFKKSGSRVFFDDLPIWLASMNWTARAEIRIIAQTREANEIRGIFRVLDVYDEAQAAPLTRVFRRMFAGGTDPFIYLLMSPEDHARACKEGNWDPRKKGEAFIHASPANQLTRIANKHYDQIDEVHVVFLFADRIQSPIEWEPASDAALYPHVYGAINFDAKKTHLSFRKNADHKFAIVIPSQGVT